MITLMLLSALAQVDPFTIDSKKITPEIRKEIARLDDLRRDAFEKACAAMGVQFSEARHVSLKAVDAGDPDPAAFDRHNGFAAETSSPSDTEVEIRFYVEYFSNGLLHPEETLRHEMVHAVMRLHLAKEEYQKLPKWLREGIAVHVARQTPTKLAARFMEKEVALDPSKVLDGLEDAEHNLADYAEDGLAIEFLVSVAGAGALPKLEAELKGRKEYKDAIATVAGRPYPKFVTDAQDYARKRVNEEAAKLEADLKLYREILERNDKSKTECERFLKAYPNSPLKSAVQYYLAKSSGDDAIPLYDAFIEGARKPGGFAGFIDEALLRKARLLAKKNRLPASNRAYADLVLWHVGSNLGGTALYEWGLQIRPSEPERAEGLLKRALEIDPKHRMADRARKALEG